jgi:carboxyl-terminal processing protease
VINKEEIKSLLRDEIMTRYYYQKGRVEASLAADPDIIKAKEIIDNQSVYTGILQGTYKPTEQEQKK